MSEIKDYVQYLLKRLFILPPLLRLWVLFMAMQGFQTALNVLYFIGYSLMVEYLVYTAVYFACIWGWLQRPFVGLVASLLVTITGGLYYFQMLLQAVMYGNVLSALFSMAVTGITVALSLYLWRQAKILDAC